MSLREAEERLRLAYAFHTVARAWYLHTLAEKRPGRAGREDLGHAVMRLRRARAAEQAAAEQVAVLRQEEQHT